MEKVNITVREVVKGTLPFVRIFLFGSRARNDARTDSDYDFLVVTPSTLETKEKVSMRSIIRKKLLEKGIRSDILIQSEEELVLKKQIPGHIIRTILKEAIII